MQKKICGECGGHTLVAFRNEMMRVGPRALHGMVGERCADCGEVYLDAKSQARYAAAADAQVLADRVAQRELLIRVRRKLGLTQAQAAKLTGGGHNAFSRYERGQVQPMPAVINLFRLLDNHPDVLGELI